MIRSFFVVLVFPVRLFLVLRSLIGGFFKEHAQKRTASRPAEPQVTPGGELKKDPVCGTYVSTATAVMRTVQGQTVYFCSKECANKLRA